MFFELMIAILLGLASPSHTCNNSTNQGTTVSATDDETPPEGGIPGDTGGESGHIPPKHP